MKIRIIGAGPAGLYLAILVKRVHPHADVAVFEQGAADATWGFGVVFSERALEFLRADDPETADLIVPLVETWSDITVVHRGERVTIDGVGFSAVGRLEMLRVLQRRAADLGVALRYGSRIEDLSGFGEADLIVGADGVNSVVRAEAPESFGESVHCLRNRFVWYGADRSFDTLTQTFRQTPYGPINAHHYRFAPDRSTFLVECSPETFDNAGFVSLSAPESRAVCERIFSDELDGAKLLDNNSIWRRFPVLRCSRWYYRNRVLVGDALHTAHYSIGSGTRLALEDVAALVRSLERNGFRVPAALPDYQESRQPILDKLCAAALRSAGWYERFGEHMALAPWPFALSYILRSGRLDEPALRATAPRFCDGLDSRGIAIG